jgi:multiple antibiotic resistance protein
LRRATPNLDRLTDPSTDKGKSLLSSLEYLASAFVTLLVVVEPLGFAPIFLTATVGLEPRARRRIAYRACLFAFAILTGAAIVGDRLLDALGISLAAFRIAGGLLLFSIASEMVFGVRIQRDARAAEQALEERVRNIAAFPLAIPLMAGPGAITATLLLAGQARGEPLLLSMLVGVIAAVCVVCLAVYLLAGFIERFFGTSGNLVLAKILGVLLASLAVQYVVDGARELFMRA